MVRVAAGWRTLDFDAVLEVTELPDSHYECYEPEIREATLGTVYLDGLPFMDSVPVTT